MSRSFGNKKPTTAMPGMPPMGAPAAATARVNTVAPALEPPVAVLNTWGGGTLSSSSSSSSSEASGNSSGDESDGAKNEKSSSSSENGSGSSSGSSSSSGESDSEDDVSYMMDKYFREKYMDKLKVIFKAELPGSEHDFLSKPPTLMRAPTFMPIEPSIFDENSYQGSANQKELKDNESRMAFISKLRTTVRWRETQDATTGALYKESNARMVTWSDGSHTFHVGDEAFDVISHPVSSVPNQLYVGLGNYYRQQCEIMRKLTLRPKLESNFGISHVQGMRNRALNKPANGCVKILTEITTDPALERERMMKEEYAQNRKEKRRELQNQRKQNQNQVNPIQQPSYKATSYNYHSSYNVANPSDFNRSAGLRTNRNTDMKVARYEELSDDLNDLEDLTDSE